MDVFIPVEVIDSAEFSGSEPVDRATWLCLLRYCCGQENNGRILECSKWGDRRWQQSCKVTLEEVRRECGLWYWEEFNLVVKFYPIEKQTVHQRLSQKGKEAALNRWEREKGLGCGRVVENAASGSQQGQVDASGNASGNAPGIKSDARGNAVLEERLGIKGINGSRVGVAPGPVTTNFNDSRSSSWGAKNPHLVESLIHSWELPDVKVIDVLRYWRVSFDLKGVPLNAEWIRETKDQPPAMVGLVFINSPENSITLPSHYRAARKAFETSESKTA